MFYKILGFLISAFFALVVFQISLPFLLLASPILLILKGLGIISFVCKRIKNL